jgi:uncharacterized repeat protein (TIGR03803 family)
MKPFSFWRVAGVLCVVFLHGMPASAATEKVIHSFCQSCTDGGLPAAGVINLGGIFYGTTPVGGNLTNSNCTDQIYEGCGVAFGIDPASGKETMLYAFCNKNQCGDGGGPSGALVNVRGKLFGMTQYGGAYGNGTIFSIDPATGAEKVGYSFGGQKQGTDGLEPLGSLIKVKGTLYGTTDGGGRGYGTVFSFTQTGTETVLYTFGGAADGSRPNGDLLNIDGTLYGTTEAGGSLGGGTVFSLNLATGAETVLHSFAKGADGSQPYAGLIDVKGRLYGTTVAGGASGHGTVFAVNPATGKESVLYSFCPKKGCVDGNKPEAGVLNVNGTLYGTTLWGGPGDGPLCSYLRHRCGVVFSLDAKTGAETVVYAFCSNGETCPDGQRPESGLMDVNGTLYGTTSFGGKSDGGTVFSLTP